MNKSGSRAISDIILKHNLIIIIVTILSIIAIYLGISNHFYKIELNNRKSEYLNNVSDDIYNDIQTVESLLIERKKQLKIELEDFLKSEVEQSYQIAQSIYNKNIGKLSNKQILKKISNTIRPLRFHNRRGYIFINGCNGNIYLNSDNISLENRNLWNEKDGGGKYLVRDMAQIAMADKNGGYYNYQWSKPGRSNINHRKLAFVKEFAPLNFYIGAGEYIDNFEELQKIEFLKLIRKIHLPRIGEILVGSWNDSTYTEDSLIIDQLSPSEFIDSNNLEKIINTAKSGGGFLIFPYRDSTGNYYKKLNYIESFKDWKWYIVGGVNTGIIDDMLVPLEDMYRRRNRLVLYAILTMMILITITIIVLTKKLSIMIEKDIILMNNFFKEAEFTIPKFPTSRFNLLEIEQTTRKVAELVNARYLAEKEIVTIEKERLQDEKLKTIGQLAGGIAHDFNNQLAGIIGFAELIKLESTNELSRYADTIIKTAERGSELTAKLLAFARKGNYEECSINLNKLVDEVIVILNHTIPKNISISKRFKDSLELITYGDYEQIQNAILNIGVNARDALINGGSIIFDISKVTFSTDNHRPKGINVGEYNCIKIIDNGVGISDNIIEDIFTPFFTTKSTGGGIGMGLSAVEGTVKRHDGTVLVESIEGNGSTFSIYFPYIKNIDDRDIFLDNKCPIDLTGYSIAIVDDEIILLTTISKMLTRIGAKVSKFNSGEMLLKSLKDIEFNLVIMDMNMPGIAGKELFNRIRDIDNNMGILISSGDSISNDVSSLLEEDNCNVIQKPFKIKTLRKMIINNFKIV